MPSSIEVMLFKRKKDVDLRDLQKRGILRIPKDEKEIPTDKEGFVELGNLSSKEIAAKGISSSNPKGEAGFLNFLDSNSSQSSSSQQVSSALNVDQRELDRKLEELDNKLYKLEQRVELVERKAGVGSSSGYSWQ
jgi:hypothetical protein